MGDQRDRNRMVFETDEVLKRAIRMRAALDGVNPADVINNALRDYLAKEVALATERLGESKGEGGTPRSRKRKEDRDDV